MIEAIRQIKIEDLDTKESSHQVLMLLLNVVEHMSSELESVKKENQELKDEINRLKGEHGVPDIAKESKKEVKDISSHKREEGKKADKDKLGDKERVAIGIDREVLLNPRAQDLPPDAELRYYRKVIVQDLKLVRDNVAYTLGVYYSPSLQKTYSPDLPFGHQNGGYGSDLRSLIQILYHKCQMTEGKIEDLLKDLEIRISCGSISNILLESSDWALEEQRAILAAGIEGSSYTGSDSTQNKEKGVSKKTHIIVGMYFVAYYTLSSKARLDVIRALLGNPEEGLQIRYNEQARNLFQIFKISQEDQLKLSQLLEQGQKMSLEAFKKLVEKQAPAIFLKKNIFTRIQESLVLGYYHTQADFPIVDMLLSDNAPEYQKIARLFHALCWVHDARHYNKLNPQFDYHRTLLKAFQSQYWDFYDKLRAFKKLQKDEQINQKTLLSAEFDALFSRITGYDNLDKLIQLTKNNKVELLAVLLNPALPLHNNAAELAVRQIVRKRDISLHTWSDKGSKVRDAFLTIIETAKKLGVSSIKYLNDRIAQKFLMPPLASLVAKAYA
jgi:Transposase IS66 family